MQRATKKAFAEPHFIDCHLLWMFSSRTMSHKINWIHKKAILVYSGYIFSFEDLLEKEKSFSIHRQNIQDLATKIHKFLHGLSPKVMDNTFFRFLSFSKSI